MKILLIKTRNIIISLFIVFNSLLINKVFSQNYCRLGFTNDINGGLSSVKINKESNDLINSTNNTNSQQKFYNCNFRFGGSLIGSAIFKKDSKFFIGEYYQLGVGVGYGSKSGNLNSQYNGTTFNVLLGFNLGLATCYSFNEELTVGLKVIGLGGDYYLDFDQNPVYNNGLTFHPTAQYKNFYASFGFGGRVVKGFPYKTIDGEIRFNFKSDQSNSVYLGLKYQLNKYDKTEINFNYNQSISSIGFTIGKVF
jgi:hypothetical protein